MSAIHRVRVILGFNFGKVPVFLEGTRNIYAKMSADTQHFPAPNPPMPTYLGFIQAVESAQPPVISRTKGASAIRQTKTNLLVTGSEQLVTYVQGIADGAQPDQAAGIVLAAGMQVAERGARSKAPLAVIQGPTSGTAVARAFAAQLTQRSAKTVVFSWQSSLDGGKSWVLLPPTGLSQTTIVGIAPLSTVTVRVAVTVGKLPMSAWSQPVSFVVM